jgi:hypothetical protein
LQKKFDFGPNLIKEGNFSLFFPSHATVPLNPLLLHARPATKLCKSTLSNILIFGMRIEEDSDEMEVNVLAGCRTRHLTARVVQTDLVTLCYLTKKQKIK